MHDPETQPEERALTEPSVLDFVLEKLQFWRKGTLTLPAMDDAVAPPELAAAALLEPGEAGAAPQPLAESAPQPPAEPLRWPWRGLAALLLALAAQTAFEPPDRAWQTGLLLWAGALLVLIWSWRRNEWLLANLRPDRLDPVQSQGVRLFDLVLGTILALIAFFLFGSYHLGFLISDGNKFTFINFYLWLLALAFLLRAFWLPQERFRGWLKRTWSTLRQREWRLNITRFGLLFAAALLIAAFFRYYRLAEVPPEMLSDHAEKLLDVFDVLNGETRIFFPRNTGREAFQMYLTAAVILLANTGFTFLSLKLGTVTAGMVTLPYIYLLGKEIGNKRVGLLAMLFAGIAYWPNVIARISLRFMLYPFFAAPLLYHLIRGLRTRSRNQFILAGIWLGAGLHGYSAYRIVPLLVVIAVVLYLLHRQSHGGRQSALLNLGVIVVISVAVFLPLGRYLLENPDMFSYRALTRVASLERELPGPAWQIFLDNLWKALAMFGWDNGEIWPHSVPGRPALDAVAAALFYLGAGLLLLRYLRQRHWQDLFLLVAIPFLMLPSILSLAFPGENPSLNRTGAALIPVFVIVGLALDGLMRAFQNQLRGSLGKSLAWLLALVLFAWSSVANYDLVFVDYFNLYRQSSWNTSEIGALVRTFDETIGDGEQAWVVAYPHWVDTRLAAINAGMTLRDMSIWPPDLHTTQPISGNKLFIVNPNDQEGLATLAALYPNGALQLYDSAVDGKDFYVFLVVDQAANQVEAPGGLIVVQPTPTVPPEPADTP